MTTTTMTKRAKALSDAFVIVTAAMEQVKFGTIPQDWLYRVTQYLRREHEAEMKRAPHYGRFYLSSASSLRRSA